MMNENIDPEKPGHEDALTPDENSDVLKPGEIVRAARELIRIEKRKEAYVMIQDAAVEYPDDPFILSYYGWLQALLDKRYRPGVDRCKMALTMVQRESSHVEEKLYPLFYLNLGRAYVAASKKKEAFAAFDDGLRYDKRNREILQELKALGSRKKSLVPFLDRSNPVNKIAGLILHRVKKTPPKKK